MDDRAGLVDSQWEETGLKKGVSSAVNPLFKMAIISGVETIVRLHVNRCKDVNCQDGAGFSPLMLAASRGYGSFAVSCWRQEQTHYC